MHAATVGARTCLGMSKNLILCVILVLLGLARCFVFGFSFASGRPIEIPVLNGFLSSPLPAVFTEPYFFSGLTLRLTLNSGKVEEVPFDIRMSQKMVASTGRSRILYLFLGRPHLFPDAQWQRVMQYYFCETSIMTEDLGIREKIKSIYLYFVQPAPTHISKTEFSHVCD